ncbi:MAG: rhodanese-like domain-containing protein [Candidatus Eisenbacteria bacterium]|nr:rhodanese-like domain-containing protein [Candidatus Eisenbacteria bacterium]
MRRICLILASLVCLGSSYGFQNQIRVTPGWLGEHLQDSSLVVLHVASLRADYTREHIPGARFLWPGWMTESTPELSFEVRPVAELDTLLEGLGISNSSNIVICHVLGDAAAAARVYVTLDFLGLGDRAYILDGGLEAWKAEGKPVIKEITPRKSVKFTPMIRSGVFVGLEYVKAQSGKTGFRLVDCRSAQGFNAGGVGMFRAGHIPGAVNLPFPAVLDSTNKYLPMDSLKAKFESAGIKTGDEIITYCYSGRATCPVYVAAKMLGYNVHLYDGSFDEWSRHEDLPVEVTKK